MIINLVILVIMITTVLIVLNIVIVMTMIQKPVSPKMKKVKAKLRYQTLTLMI